MVVGDYVDNQLHGHGTKTWCAGPFAGNRYVGGFRGDKKHGVGSYFWATGDRYHGLWRDGPRHGAGVFTSSAGVEETRVYDGGLLTRRDGEPVVADNRPVAPCSPLAPRRP